MQQALGAGHDLDECSERRGGFHRAFVDLADDWLGGECLDHLTRALHGVAADGGDRDQTRIVDRELGARLVLNPANGLALRANEVADLLGADLHRDDARCVARKVGPRLRERLVHLTKNVHAPFACLGERFLHDLEIQALDLDVHLDRGDAGLRARDLEVHVAEVVLGAEDVGENRVALPFLDESHRDAGNSRAHRNTRVEEGQGAATNRRHRRRAVGLEDIRDNTNRVGEFLERRQYALECALGEVAVADLAARRTAHGAHFASRERREVVMQHERLRLLLRLVDRVEALDVVLRA